MKYLLLVVIQLYWRIIPAKDRRICLFKESCSVHVYRITISNGLIAGIKALLVRHKQCRPQYVHISIEGKEFVVLADNSLLERENLTI